MKKPRWIELLVLLIVGLGSVVEGIRLTGLDNVQFDRLGPGGYNIGIGAILIVLGVAYFLVERKKEERTERKAKEKRGEERTSAGRQQKSYTMMMVSIIGVLGLYALLINWTGYLLASAVFFILINRVVGFRSWTSNMAVSAVMTACYYVLFVKWMGMQFPRGLWIQF
jgi:putative tricarboxylic transport membrane protein